MQLSLNAARRGPKSTSRTYALRGRVRCGVCGRAMHGETRVTKHKQRVYYRCPVRGQYPGAATDHTGDVFLPEAPLLDSLDSWIAKLFAPAQAAQTAQALVEAAELTDTAPSVAAARERVAQARRRLAQYRSALDAGADPATVTSWITETAAEERAAEAALAGLRRISPAPTTVDQVLEAVTELGGLVKILPNAEPQERADLYAALGVEVTYQPDSRTAELAVEPQALGQARVGGGT